MRFSRFVLLVLLCLVLVPLASAFRPNISISNFSVVPLTTNNGTNSNYPSQLNFTINLTNLNNATGDTPDDSANDAYNVTVRINGTANLSNASSSQRANATEGGAFLVYIIYQIQNGTSFVFSQNFTTNTNASGTVAVNLSVVNYTNNSNFNVNGSSSFIFTDGAGSGPGSGGNGIMNASNRSTVNVENRRPNITVVKTNTTGFTYVRNATSVNFTINVSNVGNMTAYNITVFDNITFEVPRGDQNFSFVNASVPANFSNNTWIIHLLDNGTSFVFTINLSVNGSASFPATRAFNNTVNVTNYTDNFSSNINPCTIGASCNFTTFTGVGNTTNSTATTTVNVETRRPNITINKTQSSFSGPVNYTINVTNIGNTTGFNITVRDNFTNQGFLSFQGATIVANDTANSTWVIFSIAPSTSFIFSINLTVDRSIAPTDFVNFVNVTNYTDNLTYSNLNADNTTRLVIFTSDGNVTNASAVTNVPGGASPSPVGSGGGGGGSGPGTTIKIQAVADAKQEITLWKADTNYLRIDGKDYSLRIDIIRQASADMNIGGAPLSLIVGESREVDLDGDGDADVAVALKGTLINRITLEVGLMAEPLSVPAVPPLEYEAKPVVEDLESQEDVDAAVAVEDIPVAEESFEEAEEQGASAGRAASRRGWLTVGIILLVLVGLLSYMVARNPQRAKSLFQRIKDRLRPGRGGFEDFRPRRR